jgi:TonB-linked SusC/RagA family outer membrane protein
MRKLTVMLLFCLMAIGQVWAQERTVAGKVTDEKGDPVSGASVTVKGTKVGTATDAEGRFAITVPANGRTLVVSSVGFGTMELPISGTTMNATLKVDEKSLTEVVVTGYTREKKSTFAGAASNISAKVMENQPVGAFDQALQGRAAGVQVQSASGQPGASANVTIRGISSIAAAFSQPLYVIDGVPMPAFDMSSINPNDFESITVLKDANSAGLYGSRGALGVIVITTKKGKKGATNFTFRSQLGFTQPPNATNFDMMNTQEIFAYEEKLGLMGQGMAGPGWVYSKKNPAYNVHIPAQFPTLGAQQARYDFLRDSLGGINSNWSDILFRQGFSQNYELNLSGGGDNTRFFVSMGFFDQEGTDLRSRLRRYTGRFNLDHTVGKFNMAWNTLVGYSIIDYNEGEFLGNSARNPFQMSWRAKPYENPYRPDGTIIFGANTPLVPRQIGNVLEGLYNSQWIENRMKLNSGLTLSYKILPSLILRNTLGIDAQFNRATRGVKANSFVGSLQTLNNGYQADQSQTVSQIINTTSLVYNKKFAEKHDIEVGGFFEGIRGYSQGFGQTLWNLNRNIDYTGQQAGAQPGTVPQAGSAKSGFGIRSMFATAKYTFNDKYSFNGNIRKDGTSRIVNPDYKEKTTWSAGFIWNAMREGFMENQRFFTDLRLRASYGSVPNISSIPGGSYGLTGQNGFGLFSVPNYHSAQVQSYSSNTAFTPNSPLTGLVPNSPANDQLRMEYVEKFNIGLDFAIWQNRARFTFELYKNLTRDLFVNQPLWATTGFYQSSLQLNAGTMSNKGIEASISVDVLKTQHSMLTIGINHAYNVNNIESMGGVDEFVAGTSIIREGLPYGSAYANDYLGADAATGLPKYRAQDGSVTTDPAKAGLFATFGSFLPKHVGGFTFDYSYKRFSISALFSYQFDVTRYNNIWNWITRGTPGYHNAVNASRILLTDQWEKPGDNKFYQAPGFDRGFTGADVQDAKFLRFRNLNLAYNIPAISVKGMKLIKSAKFYTQMNNVWIWSPWKGPDPEDNNNISLNEFPNPRAVVFGLDINF